MEHTMTQKDLKLPNFLGKPGQLPDKGHFKVRVQQNLSNDHSQSGAYFVRNQREIKGKTYDPNPKPLAGNCVLISFSDFSHKSETLKRKNKYQPTLSLALNE